MWKDWEERTYGGKLGLDWNNKSINNQMNKLKMALKLHMLPVSSHHGARGAISFSKGDTWDIGVCIL